LLPTSREAKYKAKAAIETFCVRLGDVSQAGVIFIGTSLHFGAQAFAGMTLAITLLWLFVAFKLYQEHKRKVPEFH
jgi:AAA family ATP:ADP antiporter